MAILLKFQKVSLFREKPFGISRVSFDIERNRKYLIHIDNPEKLNTLAGLIEGRFQKESGYIEHQEKLFIQSDRLLLGEKIYDKTPRRWLALGSEFFKFGARQRSKFGMIQKLKAKHLLDFPIYKLRGEDRIRFTLLSLCFQESGIILISELLNRDLDDTQREFLVRIIRDTSTTCCVLTSSPGWIEEELEQIREMIELKL